MINAKSISSQLFFGGLLVLVTGLPLSKFLVSLSQFILIGAWILQGNTLAHIKTAFNNRIVLALISIYVVHLIGMVYSSQVDYGLNDLRIKLTLLILPVIFSTSTALTRKEFKTILIVFVLATFISSLVSVAIYCGFSSKTITDTRQLSPFMSHIRLGIFVCMAIFSCCWLLVDIKSLRDRVVFAAFVLWFLVFLVILESITGFSILAIVALFFIIRFMVLSGSVRVKIITSFSLLIAGVVGVIYLQTVWKEVSAINREELTQLREITSQGNRYVHDTTATNAENGHLLFINVCEQEMQEAWDRRSSLPYSGQNLRGDELRMTIIRFLSSKGYPKDGDAIRKLTDAEVTAIEKGVANVDYLNSKGLHPRIKVTLWELHQYHQFRNPDGHSIAMRLEFWRTAWLIIKDNWLIGVGTGDVRYAFEKKYDEINSPLSQPYRLRAHNQFITITVALGVTGLCCFIFSLLAPGMWLNKMRDPFYIAFLVTALLSFLTEDTLETQAGLSFYAFFNCFLLFMEPAAGNARKSAMVD